MDVAHMTIIIDGCGWRGTSEMYVLSWSTRNLCKKCFLSEYDNIAQTGKHTYGNVMKPHGIYISWLPSSLLLQHHFFFSFSILVIWRRSVTLMAVKLLASFSVLSVLLLLKETEEHPELTVWNTVLAIQEKAPTMGYPTVGLIDCFW